MKNIAISLTKSLLMLSVLLLIPFITEAFISFPDKIDTLDERKNIQIVLNSIMIPSPNLKVDGVLGRVSIQTIQAFQESRGLKPDGKIGPMTRASLESAQNGIISSTVPVSCTSGAVFDPLTGLPCVSTPISTSTLNLSRTLKLTVPRMTGNDIKELQIYLNNNGYNVGTPDGVYGTGTQKVIINFQQSKNLKPDGSVGPVTLSYLKQIAPIITNSSGCLTTGGFNTITGQPCSTTPVTTIIPTTPVIVSGGGSTGGGGGGGSSTADTTKPIISAFIIPATSTSLTIPITTFTSSDNKEVIDYIITESNVIPIANWSKTKPTTYITLSEGAHTLYAWVRDAAGNISNSVSSTTTITIPPDATATTYTLTGPSSGTVNTPSTIFTVTPDNLYTGTITITPTGLTPIVKTFTNSSASQTFTITPTTTGTITLVGSNDNKLINPNAFTYTSNPIITVPSSPTGITASASNAQAIVSFTAPSSNGGSIITSYTVTSSPGNISASGNSSPITVTGLTNNTSYTFTVRAINAIGPSNPSSASNTVTPTPPADTVKPVVTAFVIPATSTSLSVSITTFTATDTTGVTGFLLTENSTAPSAGVGLWTSTAPANYTFATAGAKTLYAWARDAAGNVSTSLSDSVTITLPDTTAPIVTSFIIPSTSNSLTIPITTFSATDNVGVVGYLLTETSATPSVNNIAWTSSVPTTYTFGSVLGSYKFNFTKLLKFGMTDEDVKQLQIYLNNHGYPISITGAGSPGNETTYFGSLTKQAVVKFQESNKLIPDGIVGENTKIILNK